MESKSWHNPVFKKLAASELGGSGGHTSGIVPIKSTQNYFGTPKKPETHKIHQIVIEFWHGDASKTITTNVNYHLTKTHDHPHITGNILPAYKEAGAKVGDIVVFWKSRSNENDFKAELIPKNSARWIEAEKNGSSLSSKGGTLQLSPPGLIDSMDFAVLDDTSDYAIVSDIEDTFTDNSFPTVAREGRKKQGERYVTYRSKRKGDYALKKQAYVCQIDSSHKTFTTPVGVPYMEKHHLISMKFYEQYTNDLDDIHNIVSLCPTCHRKIHYGKKSEVSDMLELLFKKQGPILEHAGFIISLTELKKKYGVGLRPLL